MTFVRRAWPVLLGISLLPFAGWAVMRVLGAEHGAPSMQLMAFTPYVAAAAVLPLVAALATRRWWQALLAGGLVVVLGGCVLPRAFADSGPADPSATGPALRVLTANLLVGAADPAAVLTLVRDQRADVLALQEVTPAAAAALEAGGLTSMLPYRVVEAVSGSAGSALYSRYRLDDPGVRRMPAGHVQAHAVLRVPGAPAVPIESVHPCAPSGDWSARQWAREIALQPAATPSGPPRILLGDFNATLDHEGLRRLAATGYRDAAEVVGAGLEGTWPFDRRPGLRLPPVTLDHVLADSRIGVRSVSIHPIPGSDHRAVSAELILPAADSPTS